MDLQERLAREGKIARLRKEMQALWIRIRNKRDTIRWCVSTVHEMDGLEERLDQLHVAVEEYACAWGEYRQAREHLQEIEES